MKILVNFRICVLAAISSVIIMSCEKPGIDSKITNENNEKDFMSITGNSDAYIRNEESDAVKPLLHMRFDKGVSEEEVSIQFNKAVKTYMNKNKGVSTEWFFRISTKTGTQTNNGTDGEVRASVTFDTDKGGLYVPNIDLDNFGDDREEGDWDLYLFGTSYPGQAVKWVKIRYASIRLKGTDGWFITDFYTRMYPSMQSVPSTGKSVLFTYPRIWLDNTTDSGWDTYTADPRRSIGTLNF